MHNTVEQAKGLLSAKTQDTTKYLDEVVNELATIKVEALPVFDPEWFSTVWRAYMAYGPSLENLHGHGGFLSPRNGACMPNGPLTAVELGNSPKEKGRKRARDKDRAKLKNELASPASSTPSDTPSSAGDGSDVAALLMVAMEKQVDISQERARQLGLNQKILNIKALLDESVEFMDDNEKQAMRKKLFELRMQCIKDGEGGSGV